MSLEAAKLGYLFLRFACLLVLVYRVVLDDAFFCRPIFILAFFQSRDWSRDRLRTHPKPCRVTALNYIHFVSL